MVRCLHSTSYKSVISSNANVKNGMVKHYANNQISCIYLVTTVNMIYKHFPNIVKSKSHSLCFCCFCINAFHSIQLVVIQGAYMLILCFVKYSVQFESTYSILLKLIIGFIIWLNTIYKGIYYISGSLQVYFIHKYPANI